MRTRFLAVSLLTASLATAAVNAPKGGVTEASRPTLAWREWKMTAAIPRQAFQAKLAPLCLSDERAKVEARGARIRVLEARGCAEQLERLADDFQARAQARTPQVLHVVRVPAELWAPAAALVGKMSKDLPVDEFAFAAPTSACGCLAFVGQVKKPGDPPTVDALRAKFDARFLSLTGSAVPGHRWELPLR